MAPWTYVWVWGDTVMAVRGIVLVVGTIIATLAAPNAVFAIGESYEIAGQVRDPLDQALAGVVVSDGSNQSTTTVDGYRLREKLAGTYHLAASRNDLVSASVSVTTGILPGTTVRDIDVEYRLAAALDRPWLSPGPQPTATLTINTHAPAAGTGTCVLVRDRDTGNQLPATLVQDPPGSESVWSASLAVTHADASGPRALLVWAETCDTSTRLTPVVTVPFGVDSAPPRVSGVHPVDDSNTVFSDQRVTVAVADGGSGIDLASTSITVTDTVSGATHEHAGSALGYDDASGVLTTVQPAVPGGLPEGHRLTLQVRIGDRAGNGVVVRSGEQMGFLHVVLEPAATAVTIPSTQCATVAARSTSVSPLRSVVCRDVPVHFAASSIYVPSSMHGHDAGYVEHRAALTSAVFRNANGETWPATLTGDATAAVRYQLPGVDSLPATVPTEAATELIGRVEGAVPGHWTDARLEMGFAIPVSSQPLPRSNACPSWTAVAPRVECTSDPALNRVRVTTASPTDLPGQAAAQLAGLASHVEAYDEEGAYDIDIARREAELLSARGGVTGLRSLQSMEWEVHRAAAFRAQVHFDDDLDHVRGLYSGAQPVATDRTFGVMTPAELAELDLRNQALGEDQKVILDYVADAGLQSTFGGVHLDHATGKNVVGFASLIDDHRTNLLALVAHPERLAVRSVEHSETALRTFQAQVFGDRAEFEAAGLLVSSVGVNVSDNAVAMSVCTFTMDAPDLAQYLDAAYPDVPFDDALMNRPPIRCDRPSVDLPYDLIYETDGAGAAGRHADPRSPPFRGGIEERYEKTGDRCTIGFAVVVDNNAGILSSQHCFKDERWKYVLTGHHAFHAHDRYGDQDADVVRWISAYTGSRATNDAAMIDVKFADTAAFIYRYYEVAVWVSGKDTDAGGNPRIMGNIRCISGKETGGHCSTISDLSLTLVSAEQNENTQAADQSSKEYTDVMEIDVMKCEIGTCRHAVEGDSGGPVYWPKKDTDGRKSAWAAGLFYGICTTEDRPSAAVRPAACKVGTHAYVTKIEHNLRLTAGNGEHTAMLRTGP